MNQIATKSRLGGMRVTFTTCGLLLPIILSATFAFAQDPVIGPQVRVDVAGGEKAANETSIASVDTASNEVVATWNDWRESSGFTEIIRMGVAVSLDGGVTWEDFLVRPPAPNQSSVEGDPMACYDNRTGTLWVGAISFAGNGGLYVARKVPGSISFEPSVQVGQQFFADKGWMAAGAAPGDPGSTSLYIAYNEGLMASDDMGDTWSGPFPMRSGIGFLPRVGPDGELYVTYWDFGSGVMFLRSFDGGRSFDPAIRIATRMDVWSTQDGSRFPGTFRVPSLNALAVDPSTGTLYCVYFDTTNIVNGQRNVDLYFAKSTDKGSTWTTPVIINGDNSPPGDQFFPWLEVDDQGRLHLVFYDGRNTIQNDNVVNGMFDAYYSYSTDEGDTWTEARLTPQPFNSDDDGLNRSSQFLGDYNGLAVGANRVYPCYLSNQNGDSDIFVHAIVFGGSSLDLIGPKPGRAGQFNGLGVQGAVPNEIVHFVGGLTTGSKSVPGCPGVSVGIANPIIIGSQIADANGTAIVTFFVPGGASGRTIYFQAVQQPECTVSNLVSFTFP